MKRYFIVYYVANSRGNTFQGQCTMICEPFINRKKTIEQISCMNQKEGVLINNIVLTGFNEVTQAEFEIFNQ